MNIDHNIIDNIIDNILYNIILYNVVHIMSFGPVGAAPGSDGSLGLLASARTALGALALRRPRSNANIRTMTQNYPFLA